MHIRKIVNNVSLLVTGNAVSYLGDLLFLYALNWWMIKATGDTKMLGTMSSIAIIPMLVLNIFGGTIVDLFNRKHLMIICDLISGITMIILLALSVHKINIFVVIASYTIISSSFSVFSIANRSIVSNVVDNDRIQKFNYYYTIMDNTIKIGAPLICAIFINIFPIEVFFLLNGLSFIFSALCELLLEYKHEKIQEISKIKSYNLFISGIKYVWQNIKLRKIIVLAALVNFFIVGYNLYIPLYCNVRFHSSSVYTIALSAEAIGGIMVAFISKFIPKLSDENSYFNGLIFLLMGLSVTLIQIGNDIILFIGVFLFGYFLAQFNVIFFSYIQKNVDTSIQGRVFSVIFTITSILMPIGNMFFGFIGKRIINYSFFLIGFGIIALSTYSLITRYFKEAQLGE